MLFSKIYGAQWLFAACVIEVASLMLCCLNNDFTIICLFNVSREFLRKEKAKKMLGSHIVIS